MQETMNSPMIAKEEVLMNAAFRRRTNYENADTYKIFSILYGLVVFIGGVTFSVSHAIVTGKEGDIIRHLAEIYFTYLYWTSICWIIFCIIDIVRHQNRVQAPRLELNRTNMVGDGCFRGNKTLSVTSGTKRQTSTAPLINLQLFEGIEENSSEVSNDEQTEINPKKTSADDDDSPSNRDHRVKSNSLDNLSHRSLTKKSSIETTRDAFTRRHALDTTQKRHLRSYVRHRKNSVVQHVIGYHYDDHSTTGGLYTRVGIGIFCLGTVIHSGLSILSNLENRPCIRWTAIMDDSSRLLFSFSQFFFIFKHSNLIIRAHENLSRLSVIHIVVTNLCVWFRMIVIETTSEIKEVEHEHKTVFEHFHNGTEHTNNILRYLFLQNVECSNSLKNNLLVKNFIHEGYVRLKPILYPCTIEFSLMCLTLFFLIWENIGKTFNHKMSNESSTKNVFMVNCRASIKGLFGGMIVFSSTLISIILYAVFRSKTSHHHSNFTLSSSVNEEQTFDSIVILEIVNLCLLTFSLCATIWALIKIRKLNYQRTTTRFDDVLFIVSLAGIYLYSIFSAFAVISNLYASTLIVYVKLAIILLEFVEGTVHTLFILIALRKRVSKTKTYEYPAREIITLLIILDLSLWLEKTTTTTKNEANPFQLAFYHVIPWSIISAIATPLQIFFRFHASVCLSHVWANMYYLPVYEQIVH